MGRFGARAVLLVGVMIVGAPLGPGCSGATDSDPPPGGFSGGGTGAAPGSGGTKVGVDGSWPDAPGVGGDGTGATGTGGSGGGVGGTGTGGSGASGGGAGGSGAAGASGGAGGSGGCGVESCNNLDDNCNGQIDEGLSQTCTTACGSGTQSCKAGVWGACSAQQPINCLNYSTCKTESQCVPSCPAAPSEACNLTDDNCDNNCDDFAGCRSGVHRSYGNAEHFYTTSLTEAQCCGYKLENQDFFYLYKAQTSSLVAFYRCLLANGKHFYTKSSTCEGSAGSKMESVLGYIANGAVCGSVPLYRTSHSNGEHFYTTSLAEKNNAVANLGYKDEGIAGYVWTAQ